MYDIAMRDFFFFFIPFLLLSIAVKELHDDICTNSDIQWKSFYPFLLLIFIRRIDSIKMRKIMNTRRRKVICLCSYGSGSKTIYTFCIYCTKSLSFLLATFSLLTTKLQYTKMLNHHWILLRQR